MDQPDLRGEILIFLRLYGFFRLVSVSIGKEHGFCLFSWKQHTWGKQKKSKMHTWWLVTHCHSFSPRTWYEEQSFRWNINPIDTSRASLSEAQNREGTESNLSYSYTNSPIPKPTRRLWGSGTWWFPNLDLDVKRWTLMQSPIFDYDYSRKYKRDWERSYLWLLTIDI